YRLRTAAALALLLGATLAPRACAATIADSTGGVISSAELVPASPHEGDAVAIRLRGRAPWQCPRSVLPIFDPSISPHYLAITVMSGGCADTSRAWSMDVPIGTPVAGGHVVTLIVLVSGSTHVFHDWYYEIQPATSGTPRPAPGVFEVSHPAPDPFRAAC